MSNPLKQKTVRNMVRGTPNGTFKSLDEKYRRGDNLPQLNDSFRRREDDNRPNVRKRSDNDNHFPSLDNKERWRTKER